MVKVGFLLSHFLLSVFSQEDQPINLTLVEVTNRPSAASLEQFLANRPPD